MAIRFSAHLGQHFADTGLVAHRFAVFLDASRCVHVALPARDQRDQHTVDFVDTRADIFHVTAGFGVGRQELAAISRFLGDNLIHGRTLEPRRRYVQGAQGRIGRIAGAPPSRICP